MADCIDYKKMWETISCDWKELKFDDLNILVIKVPFNVPKETLADRCRSIINEFQPHKVLCIPNDYEISVMRIEEVEQIRDKITEYIEMVKGSNNE